MLASLQLDYILKIFVNIQLSLYYLSSIKDNQSGKTKNEVV